MLLNAYERPNPTDIILGILLFASGYFWLFCLFKNYVSSRFKENTSFPGEFVSIDEQEGFLLSRESGEAKIAWKEILFIGAFRTIHPEYKKVYLGVFLTEQRALIIDADLSGFVTFAEQIYLYFPEIPWNWYYLFRFEGYSYSNDFEILYENLGNNAHPDEVTIEQMSRKLDGNGWDLIETTI